MAIEADDTALLRPPGGLLVLGFLDMVKERSEYWVGNGARGGCKEDSRALLCLRRVCTHPADFLIPLPREIFATHLAISDPSLGFLSLKQRKRQKEEEWAFPETCTSDPAAYTFLHCPSFDALQPHKQLASISARQESDLYSGQCRKGPTSLGGSRCGVLPEPGNPLFALALLAPP